jgi:hypothetical protein
MIGKKKSTLAHRRTVRVVDHLSSHSELSDAKGDHVTTGILKDNFHSGKSSVDWNGEHFSLY